MSLSKEEIDQLFDDGWSTKINGDYNRAKECFQKIISNIDQKYAYKYIDSFNGLGNIAFDEGCLIEAKKYYQTAVRLIPNYLGKNWQKKRME